MGMTAIKYTFEGNLEMATIMVLLACFMDGIDGSAARLLKSSSALGAQLDSLADLVNFGVTPAIIIFHWQLIALGWLGWCIVLIYTICTALRLARYNVESTVENSIKSTKFFTGVASPCAAILVLTPLISTFKILQNYRFNIAIICFYMIFISLMMVSRIPTISTKSFKIEKHNITFIIAILAIVVSAIFSMPWIIIPMIGCVYIMSIPFSWFYYREKKNVLPIQS